MILGWLPVVLQAFGFDRFCSANATGSIIKNCRLDERFLQGAIEPFMFVTGGYMPIIFWGVIVLISYIRYHNAVLSAMVGIPIFLTSAILLPEQAQGYVFLLIGSAVATALFILIWKIPRD